MRMDRYQQVLDQILNHPETWNQKSWHTECGTQHCIAGWAQILGGYDIKEGSPSADAKEWLEASEMVAIYLFKGCRRLEDFLLFNGEESPVSAEGVEWARRPTSEGWWVVAMPSPESEDGKPWLVTTQQVHASDLVLWNAADRNRRLKPEEYVGEKPTCRLWHGPIVIPPFPEL